MLIYLISFIISSYKKYINNLFIYFYLEMNYIYQKI